MDYDDSQIQGFIGQLILRERKRQNCSQEALARDLGIHIDTLRSIEKGRLSARLSYYCQIALKLFKFDLEKFIINCYFNQPSQHDYANLPWLAKHLIDLCYRQTKHDQLCHLIIDHLKKHPLKQPQHRRRIRDERTRKTRSNEMDRRSTLLGLTSTVVTGPELMQNLHKWLNAFDKNTTEGQKNLSSHMGKLGNDHIELLQLSAKQLYESRMRYGGGDQNRRLALTLLHEVSAALKAGQAKQFTVVLFKVMANLADTIAKLYWHAGCESSAQNYYLLAIRAAHAAHDRLFAARVLVNFASQMNYLNKAYDSLNLIHLAQHGTHDIAGPQIKAMLFMREALAYSALGEASKFQRATALSEENLARVKFGEEPYWMKFCDQGQLAGITGGGLRRLALHKPHQYAEQSSELYAKAIQLRKEFIHSYTAQDYIGLAESRLLLKDTELVVDSTEKALTIFNQLQNRCSTVRRRLSDLYQYTKQVNQSSKLQALNIKLKSVLTIT